MNARFRIAEPDDAAAVQSIYAPYCESSHVSFEIVPPSDEQMRDRIARILPQYPWLIAEIDRRVVGYVYANQYRERPAYRWSVEVAVYIGSAHERKGLGRALYTSLFAILRDQGYIQALAGITLPNHASVGLHEALGFRPVGEFPHVGYKLGRWLDVGWWQLDLQPRAADPAEPRPFLEIRDDNTVRAALAVGQRLM